MSRCISENRFVLLNDNYFLREWYRPVERLKLQWDFFLFTSGLAIYCYIAMRLCF